MQNEVQDSCTEFVKRLREETRIYNNFPGIIEKVERDGHLNSIFTTISTIFLSEMDFAITRRLIRAQANEDQKHASRYQEAAGDQSVHLQGKSQADFDCFA